MKLIYEFKSFGSPVTCLAQAPSVDIIAIGLLNGTIILYDIKADEELMRLQQDGKVTAITFRTDGKQALMATASMQGQIALWDLDSRQLFHVMMTAHDAAIQSCAFYTNQPIMVTASEDNSLKMWIFDSLDGLPRLLKLRSGHYKPPTKVRYYGDDGKTLVTAGQDQTLRHFSMIRDAQNVEFSQGSIEKKSKDLQVSVSELKAPVITSFDTCTTRAKEWDNILTSHFQSNQAHTWSTRRKAKGSYTFVPKDASSVKSTALSACGHFGFIGSALGTVDKFNLQSGIHRGSFKGHTKAVVAIATDNTNRVLVTGSLDKTVKFWDFSTGALLESMTLDACIEYMVYHRDNNLLVIVTDDLCIRVLDTETKTIVREFWGHEARITDVAFSFDGRWLVSSSLDSTIRTWDLPTSYLIDVFQVEAVPTSVAFSPTGDFLVSTHVGKLGVFVWANRSLYETMPVRNLGVEAEVRKAALPLASGEAPLAVEEESKDAVMVPVTSVSAVDWENISDNLITLSSVAKAKWQNLLSLDAIKVSQYA